MEVQSQDRRETGVRCTLAAPLTGTPLKNFETGTREWSIESGLLALELELHLLPSSPSFGSSHSLGLVFLFHEDEGDTGCGCAQQRASRRLETERALLQFRLPSRHRFGLSVSTTGHQPDRGLSAL